MLELFIKLLIAHVLGDFFLQPKKWVKGKKEDKWKSKFQYYHALVHAFLAYLLVLQWDNYFLPLAVFVIHLIIDITKSYCKKKTLAFILDQVLHIFSLFVIAYLSTEAAGYLPYFIVDFLNKSDILILVLGYLFMTKPIGFLIQFLTEKWQDELVLKQKETGLKDAGKWIGYLERILIFSFLLFDQFEAIGFLMTAKSVFRFGDLTRTKERKLTEYILIGTLLSFTLAIVIGKLILLLN
jgi:hypothetical protein